MNKAILKFLLYFCLVFIIDQIIKWVFLNGFSYKSSWIDLVLTFNKGVAFSMFAFLGEYLKIIQIILMALLFSYLMIEKTLFRSYPIALGLIFGGGASNVLDRFIHGGVVDYVFWHKWFEFAVFNFADVMIDLGVVIIILQSLNLIRKKP
nr:lipoprotein signal peptidase [Campylobacter sp.]